MSMELVEWDHDPGEKPREESFRIPVHVRPRPISLDVPGEFYWQFTQSFRWSTVAEESFAAV